ncbi:MULTISPECIES: sporulation protein [unclassified Actinopolyspora]|uniref:sporulation protein n=1 Tax=Actinopolyspora TaxID=1849 RepID=UPI0013F5E737|nr:MULTISPECIES: sporulation protein [unclassified Actinopolyspora]NHD16429.1 sporulation protein [Actinopolyspora sp. BKK2]NHE75708.1 sporulation protein [Actinopolyspora sp. BKK1]
MFKRMLQAVGIGGPSVDTVLREGPCQPGESVSGEVRIGGASGSTRIQRIDLVLIAQVETADDQQGALEFRRVTVAEDFQLEAEQHTNIPFEIPLPWETPITALRGQALPGMRVGVRTEVAVARAVDTGDMDPLHVEPLPCQLPAIEALFGMGAQLKSADVEHGTISGVAQEFPFYQELEFFAPPEFSGRINEIELTFVTRADSVDVVLEADRRGGLFTSGGDALGRIHRSHEEAVHTDWTSEIRSWLEAVAQSAGGFFGGGHDSHGKHEHSGHSGGPGVGGMVAAGAAGVAAGAVGGMMLDEAFEGEEEEGDEE